MIYIDTSAFFAILDHDDEAHAPAARIWTDLLNNNTDLVCNNYVLLESISLIQHRIGMAAIRDFNALAALVQIIWVGPDEHEAAVSAFLTANRRQLSLVDCSSFEVMRRLGLRRVFTFDPHFAEQGFDLLPAPG